MGIILSFYFCSGCLREAGLGSQHNIPLVNSAPSKGCGPWVWLSPLHWSPEEWRALGSVSLSLLIPFSQLSTVFQLASVLWLQQCKFARVFCLICFSLQGFFPSSHGPNSFPSSQHHSSPQAASLNGCEAPSFYNILEFCKTSLFFFLSPPPYSPFIPDFFFSWAFDGKVLELVLQLAGPDHSLPHSHPNPLSRNDLNQCELAPPDQQILLASVRSSKELISRRPCYQVTFSCMWW